MLWKERLDGNNSTDISKTNNYLYAILQNKTQNNTIYSVGNSGPDLGQT